MSGDPTAPGLRRICVVTANRADYGRLMPVMRAIKAHPALELQCVVAGTHVLERFAGTIEAIRADGFEPDLVLHHILEGGSPVTLTRAVGVQMLDMGTWFENNRPDFVVVMGDRFDMIGVAVSASLMNIPIVHIQGGEETGSVDEALRHAITKLAHVHFPSTDQARRTIVRMGEDPATVFNFGCPSVDEILDLDVSDRDGTLRQVEETFTTADRIDLDRPCLLVVQHPVTTEYEGQRDQIEQVLDALFDLGQQAIFLWPNVDAGSTDIVHSIRSRLNESNSPPLLMVKNLDQTLFMRLMFHADCMVGNSSAGIREACYFGTPVVNIGTRQSNRERGRNVVDVPVDRAAIVGAVTRQLAHGRYAPDRLYGEGDAGARIAETLASLPIPPVQKRLHWPPEDGPAA